MLTHTIHTSSYLILQPTIGQTTSYLFSSRWRTIPRTYSCHLSSSNCTIHLTTACLATQAHNKSNYPLSHHAIIPRTQSCLFSSSWCTIGLGRPIMLQRQGHKAAFGAKTTVKRPKCATSRRLTTQSAYSPCLVPPSEPTFAFSHRAGTKSALEAQ